VAQPAGIVAPLFATFNEAAVSPEQAQMVQHC